MTLEPVTYTIAKRPWTLNAERRGSTHWSATRAMTAEWRQWFWVLGVQSKARMHSAHVEIEVAMKAPLQDTGNCYGSVKAALDGLVDAGVLPDDTPAHILSLKFYAPRKVQKGEPESVTVRLIPGG